MNNNFGMGSEKLLEIHLNVYKARCRILKEIDLDLLNYDLNLDLNQVLERPPMYYNFDYQNFYDSLVLLKLDEHSPTKNIKAYSQALQIYFRDPVHAEAIGECAISIIFSEINSVQDLDNLISWSQQIMNLNKKFEECMIALELGSIHYSKFMWNLIAELNLNPNFEIINNIHRYLEWGTYFSFQILDILNAYLIIVLEFFNDLIEGNEKNYIKNEIASAYSLICWLESLKAEDLNWTDEIQYLKEKLSEIHPSSPLEKFFPNEIQPSRIIKEVLPMYSQSIIGSFTVHVYKARYYDQIVAVKMYNLLKYDEKLEKRIQSEIEIYQKLSNAASADNCFLKFYGTYKEGLCINLVMEYLEHNLMYGISYLKNNNFPLGEEILGRIYLKLLNSFAIMEELGIYHGDIKPHNMLIDTNFNIKIIDFSISVIKNEEITDSVTGVHPIQGTPGYRAPEIEEMHDFQINEGKYRIGKADVFSLGIVMLQMMLLIPFRDYNTRARNYDLMEIIENQVNYEWAKKLFINMLNLDPTKRQKFKKLIKFIDIQAITEAA